MFLFAAMQGQKLLILFWLQVCCWGASSGGKVLVWPTDGSHWINIKIMLNELTSRGHSVTVLIPSATFLIDLKEALSSSYRIEVLPVTFTKEEVLAEMEKFLNVATYELPTLSFWKAMQKMSELVASFEEMSKQVCDSIFHNETLVARLRKEDFNVLISDPLTPCGDLVAELLGIPFLYTFRFSEGNSMERLCGQLPAPPSYVAASTGGMSDRMCFVERMKNFLFYAYNDGFFLYCLASGWDRYYSEILGRPTTLCEVMGKAEIWLIRTYWDFEFPRPFLPNFEFVGGLHCQPAKPLPEEMEKFVQSSGEHGIVVFSLGSMIKNLTEEKGNMIALALSQLPQKVLWRYKGKRPDTLGANTRLYDWIPQNDLLGHPKTKAFITHGGTNGIYEAIYHGVPMVGIPMFADQPDNVVHMKAKGMAVQLDIHTMKTEDLVDAVNTVIHNATYKENAMRLSRIHHDQPIKPLDRAVFWIEFVMRHKGAKHLRAAAHHLTWYQYHSLDVIAFLISCMAVFIFIAVKCCSYFCRKCGRIIRKTKTE
ncbi:UDP-glucuronosyltransferase 2C1 isoform X1 [Zootoca vivipara]|uniref:UDP-glucuronosyltransferase 2C1 isoform X1 n=1 Tax=Zootoca vivipara TaxID=8524 RepID=UPI0015921601|nr:UDP-glucuronosyltransferase 2C1 isoform X1 [Zootoca vivipara]